MVAPANLESLRVGEMLLGKYQIRGLIGRGGQATVYHCYDTFIDRDVAIKIMADAFDSKPEHARRAQMEARVLCRLQHPNIVQVFDAGMADNGAIYIIMELLKGRTLREVIRDRGKLTLFEALSIGAQVAEGVEIAHREHVIHRDLKPENIFVVDGNNAKVLDFGIAKFLTLSNMTTQHDTLQGTMWYISPEHVQGLGVTARSDIYALGSILYEVIHGTAPCLVGLQEVSTQAVAWSQISRVPPQLDELMPEVPSHVGRLIQRMLAKNSQERPGSMAEVADALRTACHRLSADPAGSTIAIRELWLENAPPRTGTVVLADASSACPASNMAPSPVGVRASAPPPASGSATDDRRGSIPVESGFITPKGKPNLDQLTVQAAPIAAAAMGFQVSTNGVIGADEVENPFQKKTTLFSRPVLIAAVLLGAGLGLAVGLSGHFSSKTIEPRTPALSATVSSVVTQSPAPQVPSSVAPSPSSAPAALAPVAPSSAMPLEQARAPQSAPSLRDATRRAPSNHTARATHTTTNASTTPQATPPSAGPKPRYGVDDLE